MTEQEQALKLLWGIGLSPKHHPDIVTAAKGAADVVRVLRAQLANPPADVQKRVLEKLGINGAAVRRGVK